VERTAISATELPHIDTLSTAPLEMCLGGACKCFWRVMDKAPLTGGRNQGLGDLCFRHLFHCVSRVPSSDARGVDIENCLFCFGVGASISGVFYFRRFYSGGLPVHVCMQTCKIEPAKNRTAEKSRRGEDSTSYHTVRNEVESFPRLPHAATACDDADTCR
jgi:hypothetical protein